MDHASRLEDPATSRRVCPRYGCTYRVIDVSPNFDPALALSDSYIVAVTTKDYVRVYTLFGTPYKVYRQKSPAVTCAAWRDYVMTVGNGPLGIDGTTTLRYSVENVKRDEICQNEDVVALPEGSKLQSVFFSDKGVSPYRSTNCLWGY